MNKSSNPYFNKQLIQKNKDKQLLSYFVYDFFSLFLIKDFIQEETEFEKIIQDFDILENISKTDDLDISSKNLFKKFLEVFKGDNFSKLKEVFKENEFNEKVLSLIEEINLYKKTILLNFVKKKYSNIFNDILQSKFYDITFQNILDLIYFYKKDEKSFQIIKRHILKCFCVKHSLNYNNYLYKDEVYKMLYIFKDVFSSYKSNSNSLNKLKKIFLSLTQIYEDEEKLSIYLPIYFLRDIFGKILILDEKSKDVCFYVIFYKYLLNFITSTSSNSNFINSSYEYPQSIITLTKCKSNNSIHIIKPHLIQLFNENKLNVIKEILFENSESNYKEWLNNTNIFGCLYFLKEKLQEKDFFISQRDYITYLDKENNKASFYDFVNEVETKNIDINNDLITNGDDLRVYYYQEKTSEKIFLTQNSIKIISKNNERIKMLKDEEENIFFNLNKIFDNKDFFGKAFKLLLSGKERESNGVLEEVYNLFDSNDEKEAFEKTPVFENIDEKHYYIFKKNINIIDLTNSQDVNDKEILQNMSMFFLKKGK